MSSARPRGRSIIISVRSAADTAVPLLAARDFDYTAPAVSPDGRWLAYSSTESGRPEVYVRPFPDVTGERHQVSSRGGRTPTWSRDGREHFFLSEDGEMSVVPVTLTPRFSVGEPRALFSALSYHLDPGFRTWELSPDGRAFLMLRPVGTAQRQIVMVPNWFEELRQKAGR